MAPRAQPPVWNTRYNLRPRPSKHPTTTKAPKRTPVRPSTGKISRISRPMHKKNKSSTKPRITVTRLKSKNEVSTTIPIKTESDLVDPCLAYPGRYLPGTRIRIVIGSSERGSALAQYLSHDLDRFEEEWDYARLGGVTRWVNRQRIIARSCGWDYPYPACNDQMNHEDDAF